jgi:tetratricopeptide (TPR) repeat protein
MSRFSKLELHDREPGRAPATTREAVNPLARAEDDLTAHGLLNRGLEHLFDNRAQEALRLFSRALAEEPTLLEAWAGQIEALIGMDQLREADVWTGRALERFPDDVTLTSLRAVLLARQGMTNRGIGTSDYAMAQGEALFAWIARGEVLLIAGNANANFCLDKALAEAPGNDWMNPTRVGLVHLRHRQPAKALEAFQRAVSVEPTRARLWSLIAECQLRLGLNEKAVESARRALELDPGQTAHEDLLRRAAGTGVLQRLWNRFRRS